MSTRDRGLDSDLEDKAWRLGGGLTEVCDAKRNDCHILVLKYRMKLLGSQALGREGTLVHLLVRDESMGVSRRHTV